MSNVIEIKKDIIQENYVDRSIVSHVYYNDSVNPDDYDSNTGAAVSYDEGLYFSKNSWYIFEIMFYAKLSLNGNFNINLTTIDIDEIKNISVQQANSQYFDNYALGSTTITGNATYESYIMKGVLKTNSLYDGELNNIVLTPAGSDVITIKNWAYIKAIRETQ